MSDPNTLPPMEEMQGYIAIGEDGKFGPEVIDLLSKSPILESLIRELDQAIAEDLYAEEKQNNEG